MVGLFGILCAAAIVVFAIVTVGNGLANPVAEEKIIELNDIVQDAQRSWDDLDSLDKTGHEESYVIVDPLGEELYASHPEDRGDERVSVETAMKKGWVYRPVIADGRVLGYVIMLDDETGGLTGMRLLWIIALAAVVVVFIVAAVLFGIYVKRRIVAPFQEMKGFAGRVAEGNLDEPLYMDRDNMFGAFSESFDIMREELSASRQREVSLQRRERELVASLSHDLKTPVTGIKLTCEVMKARIDMAEAEKQSEVSDEKRGEIAIRDLSEKIDNIYKKADQIDILVSDLLSSTMEELNELKVNCTDEDSSVLSDIVSRYDDRGKVSQGVLPEVVIHIDTKRMSQVIGNIISNSYKYADTEIKVGYRLVDEYLEMRIEDFGPGVPADELELITNKFYRGKQWADSKQEGSGLGLYIAKLLMEKMDGELVPENTEDGFVISLLIPLS